MYLTNLQSRTLNYLLHEFNTLNYLLHEFNTQNGFNWACQHPESYGLLIQNARQGIPYDYNGKKAIFETSCNGSITQVTQEPFFYSMLDKVGLTAVNSDGSKKLSLEKNKHIVRLSKLASKVVSFKYIVQLPGLGVFKALIKTQTSEPLSLIAQGIYISRGIFAIINFIVSHSYFSNGADSKTLDGTNSERNILKKKK